MWCKDCHSTWRTVFAQHHSLTLFASHLQEPSDRTEFEQCLLAGLMLWREGVERITHTLIRGRVDLMRFSFRLTETPFDPFAVVPLDDIKNKPALADQWDRGKCCLVTLRHGGKQRLGLTVPRAPRRTDGSVTFSMPAERHCLRRTWWSENTEDYATASAFFGAQCVGVTDEASKSAIVVFERALATPASKIDSKLAHTITACRAVLRCFGDDDWSDRVKESQLRPLLVKLNAVHMEATSCASGKAISSVAEWMRGIQHGKLFLAAYRVYVKSRAKEDKVDAMRESLQEFTAFLRRQQLLVAPTLNMLRCKIDFYGLVSEARGLKA